MIPPIVYMVKGIFKKNTMRLISVPTNSKVLNFHVGLFYYSSNYFSSELEALNELEANN